jgi:hypothetical protein
LKNLKKLKKLELFKNVSKTFEKTLHLKIFEKLENPFLKNFRKTDQKLNSKTEGTSKTFEKRFLTSKT